MITIIIIIFIIALSQSLLFLFIIQVALSHYCMRDYEQAQSVFEKAREADPHRIEYLDAYSNILYVRERRAELSYLAHR